MKISSNPSSGKRFSTRLGCWMIALASMGMSEAAFANGTNYISVASGNLNAPATWGTVGFPGTGDTIEVTSGLLVTNTTSSVNISSINIDTGGTFKIGASATAGVLTNKGTLVIGLGTSAKTLTITTNFANNGAISGDTGQNNAISFAGGVPETWTGSGDISAGKINIAVSAATTLNITGLTNNLTFRATGTLTPNVTGTLIVGTDIISGNNNAGCSFTLNSGATLVSANTNGLINGSIGTFNFTGAGAVTLNTAANYTFNGATAQVTLGLPATVNNLTINDAAGVTLSAATAINGALTLTSGPLVTTAANLPTVASSGTIVGSSYVSGPLAYIYNSAISQTFPVGKSGNNRAVTFAYTSLASSSTVTVEQIESAMGGTLPAGTSQFNTRYWAVSQTGGTGFSYNLTVDGTGFSPSATPVLLQEGTPDTSYSTTFSSPTYTVTGLTSVTNVALGNFAPASDMLAIISSPVTITSDTASGVMTVQLQNSGGSPKTYATNLTVNLSSTSGTASFRDAGDTTTITSVTITAGNNSATFKYRDTTAPATPTITASANSVSPGTQVETVNSGAANKLTFTTQPVNSLLGATLSAVVVQIQDDHGNNVAQSGTAVALTLNGASFGSGTTTINTDVNGTATYSDLVINTVAANLTITANTSGLTAATSSIFNITSRQIVKGANTTAMDQTGSWIGGIVPGINDTAVINNSSLAAAPNNGADFGASATWYGLYLTNWSAGAGYNITNLSGSTLTLGAGGIVGTNIPHTTVIFVNIALAVPQLWAWGSTTVALNMDGTVVNNGNLLKIGGTGPINLNGVISGAGGLTKLGTDTVTLGASAANTYTGPTTVSNGTLAVNGSLALGSSVTAATGGNLAGTGTINDSVTIQSGGLLTPGSGLGALTINSSLTLQAGSSTSVQVSAAGSTSSRLLGPTSITYNGTLVVTNVSGTLVAGNQFNLFPATTESGNFSSITGSAGPGLGWNFSPANGVLSVVSVTATNATNITAVVSGNTYNLSWPTDHLGWILQGQTNGAGIGITTNWFDVPGSGSSTNASITIDPSHSSVFFRLRSP